MSKQDDRRAIHQALDARLSGMTGDEWLAQRIIHGEENPKMKKKASIGLVLAVVLALVSVGALAAALYPRTADRFADSYGQAFGDRLNNGDIAEMNSAYGTDQVKCTITDVIWSDGVLYGTVVMEPAQDANVVLMPSELEHPAENLADSLMADGKTTYAQAAKEKNGKILVVHCLPNGYVLNGQTMSGDIGYFEDPMEDGSVVASFELWGWNGGIQRAESYELSMHLSVCELLENGETDEASAQQTDWTVTVQPEMKETQPETITQLHADGIPVETPADFSGKLPVYAVSAQKDWQSQVDPSWFNASKVTEKTDTEYSTSYRFEDEDQLDVVGEGYLYYYAYAGTETVMYEMEDGKKVESDPMPRNEGPQQAFDLVGWLCFDEEAEKPDEALSEITLEKAQADAEALLEKLGMENSECVWRYAADQVTIEQLNDAQNQKIANGEFLGNNEWHDGFTAADEGYYLVYSIRMNGVLAERAFARAALYMTRDGVRCAYIELPMLLGESLGEKTLISAEEALSQAVHAANKSWLSEMGPALEKAEKIELVYAAKDKQLLIPAWQITAMDPDCRPEDQVFFQVTVSALDDAAVLNAPWM